MAYACKYCLLTNGLKGSEIGSLPQTEEELYEHIEKFHHLPVQRKNESKKECEERFKKENPEAGGLNCKCPACLKNREAKKLIKRMMERAVN